jgi:serine/threonine-protein kinase
MSSVYLARDNELERSVTVKVLHAQHARDRQFVERFRREARAMARLAHPNVVTVIDRGEHEAGTSSSSSTSPAKASKSFSSGRGRSPSPTR